ncbi:hypothetical protein FQN54_008976 [Arachnomyces sp. PD_36]|nr:hypothetical protein FQN54_008976 [Arachnomyces sp. PD_36]
MPAPLAKGIVITVGVLVAAGIAVYENPQVRLWVDNSRRRIAVALHSLGDEINPPSRPSSTREDISMTEATGEEAEERRRKAKEDLLRRRAMIEARRKKGAGGSVGSFDALVDEEGRLKDSVDISPEENHASTTAVEAAEGSNLTRRNVETLHTTSEFQSEEASPTDSRTLPERMHIGLPSEVSSNHPSECLVDLTPTSEFPDTQPATPTSHTSDQQEPMAQTEYFSLADSSSTNADPSDFYYASPQNDGQSNADAQPEQSPFADPLTHENLQDISSAPSIAGSSVGHARNQTGDASSDGTLSDFGYPTDGVRTPASWSEIGSVVSGDDDRHL